MLDDIFAMGKYNSSSLTDRRYAFRFGTSRGYFQMIRGRVIRGALWRGEIFGMTKRYCDWLKRFTKPDPIPQIIGESHFLPGAEKQVKCLSRARLCAIKCLPVPKKATNQDSVMFYSVMRMR